MNYMLGNYQSAIEDYSEAMKNVTSANRGIMHFNRANSQVKLENYSDSLDDYDAADRTNVKFSSFNKGNALLLLGRIEEALESYRNEAAKRGAEEVVANNISNLNLLIGRLSDSKPKSLIHKSSGGDIRRMSQVLVPSDPSHHEAASGQLHPG